MDKEYFIELNVRQIPVSKEVYYAFKRPAWREHKRRQVRAEKDSALPKGRRRFLRCIVFLYGDGIFSGV